MKRAGLWWLALAVAVAAFVVGNVRASDQPDTTGPSGPTTGAAAQHLELRVDGDAPAGGDVTFVVTYVNRTQPVTVTFGTSQDAEVVLVTRDGDEAWRWSKGRAFTQAVRVIELGTGTQSWRLAGRLTGVTPGRYSAVATLVGEPAPAPVQLTVTVA